jgi:adenylate cyclase
MDRRLAAILYADVAGYSRLTGVDEEGTHQQLNAGLDRLTSAIDEAGGRVVHEAGDAILAEFNSTISALQCAADFQRAMADQKPAEQDGERLAFRVGINLGEVIDDRDDIYGDGVNVAARLEGLAETGGICISRAVYDQVQGKIDLGYEYLGEQSVKNIAKPVRAYKVLLDPADAGNLPKADHTSAAKAWWPVAAGLAAVLVSGGGAYLRQNSQPDFTPANMDQMALALPDKPSIAVLPFTNMSGDPEQEYFADGMTEDLITDLSKLSGLFVIARNSSFS